MEALNLSFECVFIHPFYATVPIYFNAFRCSAASQKTCDGGYLSKVAGKFVACNFAKKDFHRSCFTMKLQGIKKHEISGNFDVK